jgi:hypothetical protein
MNACAVNVVYALCAWAALNTNLERPLHGSLATLAHRIRRPRAPKLRAFLAHSERWEAPSLIRLDLGILVLAGSAVALFW